MSSISSLIYSGYSSTLSSALSTYTSMMTSDAATDSEDSADLTDAEAVSDYLSSQWEATKAEAALVYQLITGTEMSGNDVIDPVTNMLLTAYDELYAATGGASTLEEMPSYAEALSAWAEQNGVTSLYNTSA
ncbi:hypothetical protein [uncultured Cohaesibacter sp.]|uniref:hypothetical protein n=1 Tax=uncultured Cohaesibacter sp. TaxID=1002546 RepID=UPI0029C7B63C|nr:hypothetical protein [uncultured Cohaesibacter sp.]